MNDPRMMTQNSFNGNINDRVQRVTASVNEQSEMYYFNHSTNVPLVYAIAVYDCM